MKAKNLIALVVVLVVACAMAWWSSTKKAAARRPSPLVGKNILPALPVNDIGRIRFESAASTVTVAKAGGTWVSVGKHDYPADFSKVRDFVRKLAETKAGQVLPAGAEPLDELHLLDPSAAAENTNRADKTGTLVVMETAGGKEIAQVLLGKDFAGQTKPVPGMFGRGYAGYSDGRYVKTRGNIFVVADSFYGLPDDSLDWVEKSLLNESLDKIAEVTVGGRELEPVTLTRDAATGKMGCKALADDEEIDQSKADSLAGSFSYLQFEDVADPALKTDVTGLDKPVVCTAGTRDGKVYKIEIGNTVGDRRARYARVSAAFIPPEEPKEPEEPRPAVTNETAAAGRPDANEIEKQRKAAEREKAESDVRNLNKKHEKWTYIISEHTANSLLAGRVELVHQKKKDETPAAAADEAKKEDAGGLAPGTDEAKKEDAGGSAPEADGGNDEEAR